MYFRRNILCLIFKRTHGRKKFTFRIFKGDDIDLFLLDGLARFVSMSNDQLLLMCDKEVIEV